MGFDISFITDLIPSFSITKLLWTVFAVVGGAWLIYTAALFYHWNAYSKKDPRAKKMRMVYLVGSLVFLGSAASFIFSL